MRGGRVSIQQVAVDAFGNALGSSLADQSSSGGGGGSTLSDADVKWLNQELGVRDDTPGPGVMVADAGKYTNPEAGSNRPDAWLYRDVYHSYQLDTDYKTDMGRVEITASPSDVRRERWLGAQERASNAESAASASSGWRTDEVPVPSRPYVAFEDGYPSSAPAVAAPSYLEPTTGSALADESILTAGAGLLTAAGAVHGTAQLASDQFWAAGNLLTGGWLANNNSAAQAAVARNSALGQSILGVPRQAAGLALRTVTGNWYGMDPLNSNQINALNAQGDRLGAKVLAGQTALNVAGLAAGGFGVLRASGGISLPARMASGQGSRFVDALGGTTADLYQALNGRRAEFMSPRAPRGTNPNLAYGDELLSTGRPQHVTLTSTGEKVFLDRDGFPIFTPYLYNGSEGVANTVRIRMTGKLDDDFKAANRLAGLSDTPGGYVWHHHQDLGVLQLVRQDVHGVVRHAGGVAFYNALIDAGLLSGSKYPR
jgi:hypothetical protein